jgi:hypothetical protein
MEDDMAAIDDALKEYQDKHEWRGKEVPMRLRRDGLYEPPSGDTCPLCVGMTWPGSGGAHLKSIEHIAYKHVVAVAELRALANQWTMRQRISPTPAIFNRAASEEMVDVPVVRKESSIVVPETIVGWKALSLDIDHEGYRRLMSPSNPFTWTPYEVMRSRCKDKNLEGMCDDPDCSCGFYYYWTARDATTYSAKNLIVVKAELGGIVVEHDIGCRAEYATITGILLHDSDVRVRFATDEYGVPVVDSTGEPLWLA